MPSSSDRKLAKRNRQSQNNPQKLKALMLTIKFRPGEKEAWQMTPRVATSSKPHAKSKRKRKKRRAKSVSSRKSVRFDETAVGHFLYVYAPLQYCLLMEYAKAVRTSNKRRVITPAVIETIALNSDNSVFKTARFRRALIAYRRFGCKPLRKTGWPIQDIIYFAKHSFRIHETMRKCTE